MRQKWDTHATLTPQLVGLPGRTYPVPVHSQKRSSQTDCHFKLEQACGKASRKFRSGFQLSTFSQLPAKSSVAKVGVMKIDKPGQHLDHLLRTTRTHHIQLSSMADMKANMLLTMSAIIITLATPQVLKPDFQWPFLVLIVSSLMTITLAAYAVMPKIPLTQNDRPVPDVQNPQFNLLFFGDFTRLSYAQYETAMEELLNDSGRVYEAQTREIYLLGTFLVRKKFRFLRLAYLTFIAGAACSVLLLALLILV